MAITTNTTYLLPNVVNQQSIASTQPWSYPDRIKVNDNLASPPDGCAFGIPTTDDIQIVKAFLVIDGVITATNKATNQEIFANPNLVLGGTADLWSQTLTPTKVKAADFGVAVSYGYDSSVGVPKIYYLLAESYAFAIPDYATILGVQAKFDHKYYAAGGGGGQGLAVDDIQMQVTFSYDPICVGSGTSGTQCFVIDTGQPKQQKTVRYFASNHADQYVGEWRDVTSNLSFKTEINNALATMDVKFARNELTLNTLTDNLLSESDLPVTDEYDQNLLIDLVAATGLGPGTDLDLNYNVDVVAYWGEYLPLLTEDDKAITDELDSMLLIADGAPEGRTIFSGYIPDWMVDFGGDDTVGVPLLNHAYELDQIMLTTVDVAAVNNGTTTSDSIGIASSGLGGNTYLAQTFTMVGNKTVSRISAFIQSGYVGTPIVCTMKLYASSDPNSLGSIISQQSVTINNYLSFDEVSFALPAALPLTNGTVYTITFESNIFKPISTPVYPLYFKYSSTYAGGSGYVSISGHPYVALGGSLAFKIWEEGNNTIVPFNSYDPSNIVKAVIDYARTRGAHINYDASSIALTGTTVSYTFNLNTIMECLNKIIELCPADWYWTYDVGSNLYSLQPRASTAQRFITKKKDMVLGTIRKSIVGIINKVFFTGGGDPALLVEVNDAQSQKDYRVGIAKLSDQRVTDPTTAIIMAQAHINRYKNPQYIASMTLNPEHYDDLEDVKLGEVTALINFGEYIDQIEMQIVSRDYKLDTLSLELGVILPKISKRIEDIRRNLDTLEQQNNPSAPA